MLQMEKLRLGRETKSQHVHYVTPSFMLLTVAPCGSAYHYPEYARSVGEKPRDSEKLALNWC